MKELKEIIAIVFFTLGGSFYLFLFVNLIISFVRWTWEFDLIDLRAFIVATVWLIIGLFLTKN